MIYPGKSRTDLLDVKRVLLNIKTKLEYRYFELYDIYSTHFFEHIFNALNEHFPLKYILYVLGAILFYGVFILMLTAGHLSTPGNPLTPPSHIQGIRHRRAQISSQCLDFYHFLFICHQSYKDGKYSKIIKYEICWLINWNYAYVFPKLEIHQINRWHKSNSLDWTTKNST